jgi:hypothetical protein
MLQVREAIELPYRMIPGLTFGPASVVKVPWVEIKPKDPYTVTIRGSPEGLIMTYITMKHEICHEYQIMHKSLFDAYIVTEYAIECFRKMIRDEKDKRFLKILIGLTEAGIWFNPLKIEEDKRCLLEAEALHLQLASFWNPSRHLPHSLIVDIKDEKLEMLHKTFLSSIIGSTHHRKALVFFNTILPCKGNEIGVLLYLYRFGDLGISDTLELFNRIKNDNILKRAEAESLEELLDEIAMEPVSSVLKKYGVLSFNARRRMDLEKINNVLEKLKGFSQKRVRTLKEVIERSESPTKLLGEVRRWTCVILKDQNCKLYVAVNGEPEYAILMLSFYSDLYICTSMLKAAEEAFRKGKDPWKAMERAIKCPYKNAPQMECRKKSECEHEEPWRRALAER